MKTIISDIQTAASLLSALLNASTYTAKMAAYHNAVIYLQRQQLIGRRVSKAKVIKMLQMLLKDVQGYDAGDRLEVFKACVLAGVDDAALKLMSGYKAIAPWKNRILSQAA